MEYYIISQDDRIIDYAEPTGLSKVISRDAVRNGDIDTLNDEPVQVFIKEKAENEYIDFIEKPIPLITDKIKQVFDMYEKDIFYKPIMLADSKRMKVALYHLIVPQKLNCLSQKSEFYPDGTLKKLVLDKGKIESTKVFSVKGIKEDYLIIELDVVESILRRNSTGIKLKKAEVES
ncbi:MAG: serine protease [Bacillota bacterium]|nr:serine protease [Bacillota bacterium]